MLSKLQNVQHINSITHEGKVLVFATTGDGKVWYIVRKDGFEETSSKLENWEDAKELKFPGADDPTDASLVNGKVIPDTSVYTKESEELTYLDERGKTRYFSRSRYDTHKLTSVTPVQLVSGMGYLYIFRSAKNRPTVYVDRFVLDGITNTLVRKLEVRYKRSKKKHEPSEPPQDGENLYTYEWDSLDFRAADGKNFYEPTTELAIMEYVEPGRFSAVLLPTDEHDRFRWHIFAHNYRLDALELTSIAASEDGLFEFKDGRAAGVIRQVLPLNDEHGDLQVVGAPVATKYDVQVETQDKDGEKLLLRQATRVMLAVPTMRGVAAISFAATVDGSLSQPTLDMPTRTILRADIQDVMLPLDSLEKVMAVGRRRPIAHGDIGTLKRGAKEMVEMQARSMAGEMPDRRKLQMRIEDTRSYDGVYKAQPVVVGELENIVAIGEVGGDEIDLLVLKESLAEDLPKGTRLILRDGKHGFPWPFVVSEDTESGGRNIPVEPDVYHGLFGAEIILADAFALETPDRINVGSFELQPAGDEGVIFDGAITGVSRQMDGKLRIQAFNHGLQDGDPLLITNTREYNGVYPIKILDESNFMLNVPWKVGQAVNLRLERLKRRGIFLDGTGGYIEIPHRSYFNTDQFTLEAWVRIYDQQEFGRNDHVILGKWSGKEKLFPWLIRYFRNQGKIFVSRRSKFMGASGFWSSKRIDDGAYHHIAMVSDGNTMSLYLDGELDRSRPDPTSQTANQAPVYIGGLPGYRSKFFLSGEVSGVRLWGRARSADEIRTHMYLKLLGVEEGLLGYWQLGGIIGGEQDTVLDLSRNANHGTVHGSVFSGGFQLPAKLGDDSPVTGYLNEETFAVTQGATYRESFDFMPIFDRDISAQIDDEKAMLSAIGADSKPIFTFAYKGKRSRDDEGWRVLTSRKYGSSPDPAVSGYQESATLAFEYLGNGFFRAHGEFTVPDGVSLMRTFGLDNIRGDNFQGLAVANHRIQMVSDAVTMEKSIQRTELAYLANSEHELADSLDEIASLERREGALLRELRRLDDKRSALRDATRTYDRYTKAEETVKKLKDEANAAKNEYNQEFDNPLNYYCKIRNVSSSGYLVRGDVFPNYVESFKDINPDYRLWRFEKSGSAYFVRNKKLVDSGQPGYMERGTAIKEWVLVNETERNNGVNGKKWEFERNGSRYFIKNQEAASQGMGAVLGVYEGYRVRMLEKTTSTSRREQLWQLEIDKSLKAYDQKTIDDALAAWERARSRLSSAQSEQRRLADQLSPDIMEAIRKKKSNTQLERLINTQAAAVNADIESAVKSLKGVRTSLVGKRGGWNPARANSPYHMPALPGNRRGLTTSGALLGFAQTDGPLHITATSDGYVQLSYIDYSGCMRQTRYDAVADSHNSTFEEWLPDAWRRCVSIERRGSIINFEKKIPLPGEWTIEAWFYHPTTLSRESDNAHRLKWWAGNRLVHGSRESHIVFRDGRIGTIVGSFLDSGFDMGQLTPGWHHLAAVGLGYDEKSTTRFYIDGEFVGDVKQHLLSQATTDRERERAEKQVARASNAIAALGNDTWGDRPFGKFAEMRIWGLALGEEEIEANSKTTISGDEPGLLAYIPLDGDARDHGPQKTYHGKVSGADFIPCTAQIGRPNQSAMYFNGLTDYLTMQGAFTIPEKGTLEAWVRFDHWDDQVLFQAGYNFQVELKDRKLRFVLGGRGLPERIYTTKKVPADSHWHHLAVTWEFGDKLRIWSYVDGSSVWNSSGNRRGITPPYGGLLRVGRSTQSSRANFRGVMAEVRLWKKRRKRVDFRASMHRRLRGDERDLIGYWPLAAVEVRKSSWRTYRETPAFNQDGTAMTLNGEGMLAIVDSELPLSPARETAVVSTEYITYGADRSAMLRRFLALPELGGVTLLAHKRVEELELRWIGNVQMKPTLLGYIEGAPPVPSENLTIDPPSYQAASSVSLNMSEEVKYSWRREQEVGGGADITMFLGVGGEEDNKMGGRGNLVFSFQELRQTEVGSAVTTVMKNSLELRGHPEEEPKFPHLGRRFIPKNIGYALVVSGLGDLFIVRLKRSQRMLSYHIQPAEDVPIDFNTITFLINPAYTMNGSLDGLTGSAATSQRFFKDVPRMRAQYGAYYPASYYRLYDAYQRKHMIEEIDKKRELYFANYDAVLIDETSLTSQVGEATPADPGRVSGLLDELKSESERQEKVAHSTASLAVWQQKMENLRILAGKRNLVDTYVWDADGGLYAESQEIVDTLEHTIGGSFTMDIGLGFETEVEAGVLFELTALGTIHLTQTMTKTVERSQALSLEVDLSGVERLGVTDYKDRPYQPGEKVDRYRFMSFFLEGSTDNFDDFFSYVVDPEWLAGNDEEARALRQVDRSKKNKTWRVLHRVTYVERPALMNFGQDTREVMRNIERPKFFTEFGPLQESVSDLHESQADHRADLDEDLQDLQDAVEHLQDDNSLLRSKLEEVLDLLQNGRTPAD